MRDPELDREYDGALLHNLLHYDDVERGIRLSNYKPHTFTPAQREAVDRYRAKQQDDDVEVVQASVTTDRVLFEAAVGWCER